MTPRASSTVTMPSSLPSSFTTGTSTREYLFISSATVVWSSSGETVMSASVKATSARRLPSGLTTRSRIETTPVSLPAPSSV